MLKIHTILFWLSGLAFGLAIGAFIACPWWKIAVPVLLLISGASSKIAYDKLKSGN